MDDGCEEYIRQVLEAYRKTPGTMATVRRADRLLAAHLYQRRVSACAIEIAVGREGGRGGEGERHGGGGEEFDGHGNSFTRL